MFSVLLSYSEDETPHRVLFRSVGNIMTVILLFRPTNVRTTRHSFLKSHPPLTKQRRVSTSLRDQRSKHRFSPSQSHRQNPYDNDGNVNHNHQSIIMIKVVTRTKYYTRVIRNRMKR